MPIPNADRTVIEDAKVRDYLLNLRHPDGGSKDRAENKCPATFARNSPFGCFAQKVPDTFLPLIAKAIWFNSLGYCRDDWQYLATDLLAVAQTCTDFDTERTMFGLKYKARGAVGRPDHRPAMALTVWGVEEGDPPRLVTAFPDDKA